MLSNRSPSFKHRDVKSSDLPLLGDIAVIRLSGPEAEDFAQAQFMSDVAALASGEWQWSGWLNSKGRVLALFALARIGPGELRLLLLDVPSEGFCAALGRFVFRRKLKIVCETKLGAFAEWPALPITGTAADAILQGNDDSEFGIDLSAAGGPRRAWVAARGELAADVAATQRWRDDDLRHGLPRFTSDYEPSWTPHMLSLDRLKAFSVRKGCYPGQEIVARTHFLGQSKRQAWWIEGQGLSRASLVLDTDDRAIGEVVDATADGRGALAVAALPAAGVVRCGSSEALARPPLGGLHRPR